MRNNLIEYKDEAKVIKYVYFANDDLFEIHYPDNTKEQYNYNQFRQMTRKLDRNGNAWKYRYDGMNRLHKILTPENDIITYNYNTKGELLNIEMGTAKIIEYTYDKTGNVINVTDGEGNTTSMEYDSLKNLTSIKDPSGKKLIMEYNRKGLMTNLTDAESNNTTFEYNLYNLPVNIKNAMNISSEYKYNKDNSLENIINNSIQKIDLKRDIYGNIVSLRDEDGNIKEYTYDNNNNITSRKLKNSDKILKEENYGYNHNNQLEYFRSGDTEYNLSRDFFGNITEITGKENIKLEYTKDNKIAKIKKADDVIEYMYDKAGRMKEIRNGDSSQRFDYNSDMNLSSVERAGREIEFEYTKSGRKESVIYPNGIKKEITYTANGLVNSEKVSNKDKEIFKAEYVYNGNNSLIEKKEYIEDTVEVTLYEYDSLKRLIKVKYPDNEIEEFVYDSNGNRMLYNSVSKGKVKYSYNNSGRLSKIETVAEERDMSTEYIYDSEGNLIEKRGAESLSLRYDDLGRLMRAEKDGNTVEYTYDVFGNRTERKVSGEKSEYQRFSYAGSNIFEIKNGERVEKYISGQNIDEIYGKIESDGNEEYYIRDYLGNIKAIFDKDGNMTDYRRYRAYGEEEKEPENGFGFTSREYDEITGLYYYRSRYYDPTIGRFIQKDKYNEAGLLSDNPEVIYNPSQLNNYNYVANNPVNYIDPNGEAIFITTATAITILKVVGAGAALGSAIEVVSTYLKNIYADEKDKKSYLKAAAQGAFKGGVTTTVLIATASLPGSPIIAGITNGFISGNIDYSEMKDKPKNFNNYIVYEMVKGGMFGKIGSLFQTHPVIVSGFIESTNNIYKTLEIAAYGDELCY
ncbi:MAG: RHS repeat-associated core domain-containing protein [Candidatus Muirbacterium halophilum]|nr:RHS repeat-associated core domain-containing protein [Candidatus Muirbacterium halophilum]